MNPNAYRMTPRPKTRNTLAVITGAVLGRQSTINFVNMLAGSEDKVHAKVTLKRHVGTFPEALIDGGVIRGIEEGLRETEMPTTVWMAVGDEDSTGISVDIIKSIEIFEWV